MRRPLVTAVLALLLTASFAACGPGGSGPVDAGVTPDGATASDAPRDTAAGDDAAVAADAAGDTALQQDAAPQQDAQADTMPAFGCYGFVISELQTKGTTSENDEFIEIAGPVGGDLGPLKLVYREAAGTTDTLLIAFSSGDVVPASGFVVVGSNGWLGGDGGVQAFKTYLGGTTGKLTLAGGGLALRNGVPNTGTVVDSVGYGTASNVFVQGSPAYAPTAGKSVSRTPRCKSTGNNAADFSLTNPSPGR